MTVSDKHSSLLGNGINYNLNKLHILGLCPLQDTQVSSHLTYEYQSRVEMTVSDNHSSLLGNGINYNLNKLHILDLCP
jgi:hypothetical protein